MRRSVRVLGLVLAAMVWAMPLRTLAAVTVAAAADLQLALTEAAHAYEKEGGQPPRLVFGASGNLMRQIAQGAPFELFLSADEQYVEMLHRGGHTVDAGVLYAIGHVVLYAPHGSPVKVDPQLADLRRATADGRLQKLSLANPEHAPYGRVARAVLQSRGLWEQLQGKLVLGENVSQAAQYAASGAVQAGLFALSLAITPNFARAGEYVVLPEEWHPPLRQRMVLTRRAGVEARKFYHWLQSPPAREIFKNYGFALPGE